MKRALFAAMAVVVAVACAEEKERVRKASDATADAMRGHADAGTAAPQRPLTEPAPQPETRVPDAGVVGATGPISTQGEAAGIPAPPSKAIAAATEQAPAPAKPVQLRQSNGIAVLELAPNDKAVVNVELRFRSGAVDDPPGKAGLTALTARVMAEGGTKKLDSKQLLNALFPLAARLDARVDKEETTFFAHVHKDNLAKLLPILTDVLLSPRWDPAEFTRLREVAVNDVSKRLRQGDDENLGKESLYEAMYRNHPYGRLTQGHVSDLKSLTLADVQAQAAKVFTTDRLTIGVSGGAPKDLADQLAQTLSQLPARSDQPAAVPQQKPHGPRYLLVEKNADTTAISMGLPYPLSHSDPDWAAMSIARSAFGEHRQFNGRLMQRLREARGLNYGDYAYIEHFQQQGGDAATMQLGRPRHQQNFTIWLRPVRNENRLFAVRAALYELQRSLTDEPFSDAEVEQTKGFLDGYILLFDQTDARKLGYALDDAFYGVPGFLASWRASIRNVTAAQVNAAWKKWIDPAKLEIVLAGNGMDEVKKTILANTATPISYQKDPTGKAPEKPKAQLERDAQIEKQPFGAQGEQDVVVVPVEQMFE